MTSDSKRRRFLQLLAAAGSIGLAGCSDSTGSGNGNGDSGDDSGGNGNGNGDSEDDSGGNGGSAGTDDGTSGSGGEADLTVVATSFADGSANDIGAFSEFTIEYESLTLERENGLREDIAVGEEVDLATIAGSADGSGGAVTLAETAIPAGNYIGGTADCSYVSGVSADGGVVSRPVNVPEGVAETSEDGSGQVSAGGELVVEIVTNVKDFNRAKRDGTTEDTWRVKMQPIIGPV